MLYILSKVKSFLNNLMMPNQMKSNQIKIESENENENENER